jgi:hypothetical protein
MIIEKNILQQAGQIRGWHLEKKKSLLAVMSYSIYLY